MMNDDGGSDECGLLLRHLGLALHELPDGVLCDRDGSDEKKCAELMADSNRLEALAKDRGLDL